MFQKEINQFLKVITDWDIALAKVSWVDPVAELINLVGDPLTGELYWVGHNHSSIFTSSNCHEVDGSTSREIVIRVRHYLILYQLYFWRGDYRAFSNFNQVFHYALQRALQHVYNKISGLNRNTEYDLWIDNLISEIYFINKFHKNTNQIKDFGFIPFPIVCYEEAIPILTDLVDDSIINISYEAPRIIDSSERPFLDW